MKKKQLFLAAVLTGTVLISMTACGTAQDGSLAEKEAAVSAVSEVTDNQQDETVSAPEETEAETADEVSLVGESDGSVYWNDFFHVKFDAAANGYTLADEEQLAAVGEEYGTGDAQQIIDKGQIYMDMLAFTDDYTKNANLIIENVGAIYGIVGNLEATIDQAMSSVESELESSGISDGTIEKTTCTFLGEDSLCLSITGTIEGIPVYEKQVYIQSGSYIAVLTVSSYAEDTTQEILDLFTFAN